MAAWENTLDARRSELLLPRVKVTMSVVELRVPFWVLALLTRTTLPVSEMRYRLLVLGFRTIPPQARVPRLVMTSALMTRAAEGAALSAARLAMVLTSSHAST